MGKYVERGRQPPHPVGADDPGAIALLKEEHQIFRSLFDRAEDAEGEDMVRIARELCMRLDVHMTLEEEILYPALAPLIGQDEINEGIVEHGSGKALIEELEQLDGTEELFKTKVHVLGEITTHHIDEEDEDMFADATEAHRAGRIDLDALGAELDRRRTELFANIEQSGDEGPTDETEASEIETVVSEAG